MAPMASRSANSMAMPSRESQQRGGHRPERDQCGVEPARMQPVHQPATGDLANHIAPAEGREDESHLDRIDGQVLGQQRRGNRQVGAVQIVDDDRDEQQRHDDEARMGRLLRRPRLDFAVKCGAPSLSRRFAGKRKRGSTSGRNAVRAPPDRLARQAFIITRGSTGEPLGYGPVIRSVAARQGSIQAAHE